MEKVWCPCNHCMSTFGCTQNTGFKKTPKHNDNLKYLINSTGFSFLLWYISSFVFVLFDDQGTRKEISLQEVILTLASWCFWSHLFCRLLSCLIFIFDAHHNVSDFLNAICCIRHHLLLFLGHFTCFHTSLERCGLLECVKQCEALHAEVHTTCCHTFCHGSSCLIFLCDAVHNASDFLDAIRCICHHMFH